MSVPLWMQASEMISLIFVDLFHFDGASPGRFLGSVSAGSEGSDSLHSVTHCSGAFAWTSSIITFICRINFYSDPEYMDSSALSTKGKHGNLSSADMTSRSSSKRRISFE